MSGEYQTADMNRLGDRADERAKLGEMLHRGLLTRDKFEQRARILALLFASRAISG
jgi:hypothetical protein